MRRYWLHVLLVLVVTGLVGGACVVRTAPGHRHQGVHGSDHDHGKHKKAKKPKKHKKHRD